MQNKISDIERLEHILDSINSIQEFTKDISYEEYCADLKLKLALVKLFEIIGEATSGITNETKDNFSQIEWVVLKGIRHILVHEYFGIDYEIIWNSVKNKIPELREKVNGILNVMKNQE